MGIAEDLKALEELHQKGKLTDKEFSDAKAAALQKGGQPLLSNPPKPFLHPVIKVLLVILVMFLGLRWYSVATRTDSRLPPTFAPITLTDEVQNVPANSWKGVRYILPAGGKLEINLQVISGNPIDVSLAPFDQLEMMQKGNWNSVKVYADFNAVKTKTYRRTGWIGAGDYYLVLRDSSLGVLSSPASDISVKVRLNP